MRQSENSGGHERSCAESVSDGNHCSKTTDDMNTDGFVRHKKSTKIQR